MGFPGADDPAYLHELERLAEECRGFLAAFGTDDFDAAIYHAGRLHLQAISVYKLSPPAGIIDIPSLYKRPPAG